ncbi:hypothetical protein, conserved [Eimeria tenella]|uniref:Uncharacterized protein n=1 Tax=Eimeria tenella TaxID=5802 RepID=U6KNW5_EIMTE|nr:hypothetical protein, conserved [Eimeria tenella]CDJ37957.1 hypothetical protein, conserved [Eimeria tenella]|eukprot:XP_013228795.1 hypothetical protein, conserved [Eimeria tenella]
MASLRLTGEEALRGAAPLQSVDYLESPTRDHLFVLWRRGRQRGSHLDGAVILSLFVALAAAYLVLRCGLQLKTRKGSGGLRSLADAGEEAGAAQQACAEAEGGGSGAGAAETAGGDSPGAAAAAGGEGGSLGAAAAEAEGGDPGAAAAAAAAAGAEGRDPGTDADEAELDDERKELASRASAYMRKLADFTKRAAPVLQRLPVDAIREALGGVLILAVVEMTCMGTLLKGEERKGIQVIVDKILGAVRQSTSSLPRKALPVTTFRHFRFLKELLMRIPSKDPTELPLRQRLERLREVLTVQEIAVDQMLRGLDAMEELCEDIEWVKSKLGAEKFATIFKKTAAIRRNHVLRERMFGVWLVMQHKMFCHYGLSAYPHMQSLTNQGAKTQREQLDELKDSPLALQLLMPKYGYKGGLPQPRETKSRRRRSAQTRAPAQSAQRHSPEAAEHRENMPFREQYVIPPRFRKQIEESKAEEAPQVTQPSHPRNDGASGSSSPSRPKGAESTKGSKGEKRSASRRSPPSGSVRRSQKPGPSKSPEKAAAPATPPPQEDPKAADREGSSSAAAPNSAVESIDHPSTSSQPSWPEAADPPRNEELPREEESREFSARYETRSSPEAPQSRPAPGFPQVPDYPPQVPAYTPPHGFQTAGELGRPTGTPEHYGFPVGRGSSRDLAEQGASAYPFISDARVSQKQPEDFPPAALHTGFAGAGSPQQQYGFLGPPGAPVRSRAPEGPPISLPGFPQSSHHLAGPIGGQYSERLQVPGPPASPRKMPPGLFAAPGYFPFSRPSLPRAGASFTSRAAADSPWQVSPSDFPGAFSSPPPFIPPESFFPGERSPEPTQGFHSGDTFSPSSFSVSPPPGFGRNAGRRSFPAGHREEASWAGLQHSQPNLGELQRSTTQYSRGNSEEEVLLELGVGSSLLDWPAGALRSPMAAVDAGAAWQTPWSTQDDDTPPTYRDTSSVFPEGGGWWTRSAPRPPSPDFEKAPGSSSARPTCTRSTFKGMATGEPKPESSHGKEQ